MKYAGLLIVCGVVCTPLAAQAPSRELKWMRDSEEFATIFRQTYRVAGEAVRRSARAHPAETRWAVVLDIDETVLDNSAYQLELAAYQVPFDTTTWNAYVRREESAALPGAVEFVDGVRAAGGRVAYISGRDETVRDATRRNLARLGLWRESDLMCLDVPGEEYPKRQRRSELRRGEGRCAWEGVPVTVLVYVGDQMGDFPEAGEEGPRRGEFGGTYFLLPNPSYGRWERSVTRRR